MSTEESVTDAAGDASELEIVAWQPGDEEQPAVFAFSSGERAPLFRPRDERQWDWAFRRNPAGTRLFLARRAGRVVAAFGALPVRVRAFGEPRTFDFLFDLLSDASLAPGEREETWCACAQAFVAAHGGPQDDMLHYGWPAGRERELSKSELGHELLCASALLVQPLGPGATTLPRGVEELTGERARLGSEADALYAACAPQWGVSVVRDAAFLNWRFVEQPFFRYRLFVLRSQHGLRGFAAYRLGPELHPGLGLLMDLLVLPGDEAAAELLLAAAAAAARADGAAALAAALPEWSPWALFLQERGFLHHPSEHLLLVRGSLPRFDMLYLRDHWWRTLADTLVL